MRKVLFSSFLNTGVLFLFVNANLEYAPWIFKSIPLREDFNDLGMEWYYRNSRSLIQTMLITAFYPWIEFAIFGSIRQFKRILDSG